MLKTNDMMLSVSAQPLEVPSIGERMMQQYKIKVMDAKYTFYVEKEESELVSAMNCGEGTKIIQSVNVKGGITLQT